MTRGKRYALYFREKDIIQLQTKISLKDVRVYLNNTKLEGVSVSFRGSMSLEASLVIPIFLCFMMTILVGIEMVRLQTNVFEALHHSASEIIVSGTVSSYSDDFLQYLSNKEYPFLVLSGGSEGIKLTNYSDIDGDGIIHIKASYNMKNFFDGMNINSKYRRINDSITGHSFTGYVPISNRGEEHEEEGYVYITRTGVKYHEDMNCTYLRVKSREIAACDIANARNQDRGKYYACEICNPELTGTLYITDYGDRYHNSSMCMALYKESQIITKREAINRGYSPCSKCS